MPFTPLGDAGQAPQAPSGLGPIAARCPQPATQARGVASDTGSRPAHCNKAGHWRIRP